MTRAKAVVFMNLWEAMLHRTTAQISTAIRDGLPEDGQPYFKRHERIHKRWCDAVLRVMEIDVANMIELAVRQEAGA